MALAEILRGGERRRRWTWADKLRIVAEVEVPGEMDIVDQLRLSDPKGPAEFGELALTGSAMCVRKDVYFELGGMNEVAFPVGLNDIDLCLRARDFGYRVVVIPFAALTHFESATIRSGDLAQDKRERYLVERARFAERWAKVVSLDPLHNPNLSQGWTRTKLAAPPRRSVAVLGLSPAGQARMTPGAKRCANALQRLSMARAYSRAEAKAARTLIARIRASEAAAFEGTSAEAARYHRETLQGRR